MAIIKVRGTFEYHYDTEDGLVTDEAGALADVEEYILFNGVNANDLNLVVESFDDDGNRLTRSADTLDT